MKQVHIEGALHQARAVLAAGAETRTRDRGSVIPGVSSSDALAILRSLPLPLLAQAVAAFLDSLKPNASWWQRIAIDTVKSLLTALLQQAASPTA